MSDINTDQITNSPAPQASAYEKKRTVRKLGEAAMEGFATFLFMSAIFYCRGNVALFAFGFWVILSVFGGISGAHVNPAITIGFYFVEQDWLYGLLKMALYTLFQFIGCIAGVFIGTVIVGEKPIAVITPNGISDWQVFFSEFFFTGTFFFVIAIATHAKYPPTKFAPVNCALIIAWFYMAVNGGAVLSGAALNPAVLLTLNLSSKISAGNEVMKRIPMMVLGEIVGVIIFAVIFKYIYSPFWELVNDEKEKEAEFTPVKNKVEV